MKVLTSNVDIKSSEEFQSYSFGISKEGLPWILHILRNQLYKDKVLAPIREYICNGIDAHVEAKCPNRPLLITVPTPMVPMFKVRDYGIGLSDELIRDIYSNYGDSTKRNSNKSIGQLGLGSKSAFAYGDNFVITAFVDGTKSIYNAYIDETNIGKIALMMSEPTVEENGTEISIPIKKDDIAEWTQKLAHFLQHFKVKPLLENANPETFYKKFAEPLYTGDDWKIYGRTSGYSNSDHSYAIMGGVQYPIDPYALNIANVNVNDLLKNQLVIEFKIGQLQVAASRESLQYDDRTKEVLTKKILSIFNNVNQLAQKQISEAPSIWHARILWQKLSYAFNFIPENLRNWTWGGVKIDSHHFGFGAYSVKDKLTGIGFRSFYINSRSRSVNTAVTSCYVNDFPANENSKVYFHCLETDGEQTKINDRLRPILRSGAISRIHIISSQNKAQETAFLEWSKLNSIEYININSLEPEKRVRAKNGAGVNNVKTFTFKMSKMNSRTSDDSSYWAEAEVDLEEDSGVYVLINRFKCLNKSGYSVDTRELSTVLGIMSSLGINIPTVYGFKNAITTNKAFTKNTEFVLFFDWAAKEIQKRIEELKLSQLLHDFTEVNNLNYRFKNTLGHIAGKVKNNNLFTELYKYFKGITTDYETHKDFFHGVGSCQSFLGVELHKVTTATLDIHAIVKNIYNKYPVCKIIQDFDLYYNTSHIDILVDYINKIDEAEKPATVQYADAP